MTLAVNIAQGGSNNVTMRNRLINGNMTVSQRYGTTATASSINDYTVDRWAVYQSPTGKVVAQQTPSATETGYATRVAAGFTNYLAITSQSAYSLGITDLYSIVQKVEGLNIADLAWGTANAKTVTLSAWVYSSLTGTFGGSIINTDVSRTYPFSYSIPTANTWTQISITIPGDTTGTWLTTNGIGLRVYFNLGCGTALAASAGTWIAGGYYGASGCVSVVGTNTATFYITGVQLEAGTTASPFEYRQYGTELALCQRYYQIIMSASAYSNSTSSVQCAPCFLGTMRSTPTMNKTSSLRFTDGGSNFDGGTIGTFSGNNSGGNLNITGFSGMTQFRPCVLSEDNSPQGFLTASAEL